MLPRRYPARGEAQTTAVRLGPIPSVAKIPYCGPLLWTAIPPVVPCQSKRQQESRPSPQKAVCEISFRPSQAGSYLGFVPMVTHLSDFPIAELLDDGERNRKIALKAETRAFARLSFSSAEALRGCLYGTNNPLIAGAAAQDCGQSCAYFLLGRRRISLEQIIGCHEHPRGTEPTLQPMVLPEGILEW